MWRPASATARSAVKIAKSWRLKRQSSTLERMAVANAITRQTRTLLRMREYFCAPKFCPTKVVIDTSKAERIIQKKPSILP